MQRRVVELLGLVENRDLTSQLLDVNDNINNQLLRYERYNKNTPAPAASNVTSTDDVLLEVAACPISRCMLSFLPDQNIIFPLFYSDGRTNLGSNGSGTKKT